MRYLQINPRLILISSLVLFLHVRYLKFSSLTLAAIIRNKPHLPRVVTIPDIWLTERVNSKATKFLNRIGVPNEFCLKSSTILALCTMHLESVNIVIGVNKDDPSQGHAWVERNSIIISNDSPLSIEKYLIIKKINLRD